MPNRILREGILTSERVEMLNWAEEVFYRRLMSVVDDYGRYYARPALLLAACYPLLLKKVSDSDIEKWLTACVNAALVRVYPALDGKRYLQMMDFRQQVRATASKFPQPPDACAADAKQAPIESEAPAHLGVSVSGDEVVSEVEVVKETPRKRSASPDGPTRPNDVDEQTWGDWLQLRKKKGAPVTITVLNEAKREAAKANLTLQRFLEIWCMRGSQGLQADWLKPAERGAPGRAGPVHKYAAASAAIFDDEETGVIDV